MREFALDYKKPWNSLPTKLLTQIDKCSDDEARRLLLGVSK
jgi:hypothetical protein